MAAIKINEGTIRKMVAECVERVINEQWGNTEDLPLNQQKEDFNFVTKGEAVQTIITYLQRGRWSKPEMYGRKGDSIILITSPDETRCNGGKAIELPMILAAATENEAIEGKFKLSCYPYRDADRDAKDYVANSGLQCISITPIRK